MKRKRSPRAPILLAIAGATKAAMETKQQSFDVFASAKSVHCKMAHEQKFSNRLGPRIAKLSRANRGEVAERLNAAVC
jgi:hypothetical protein